MINCASRCTPTDGEHYSLYGATTPYTSKIEVYEIGN